MIGDIVKAVIGVIGSAPLAPAEAAAPVVARITVADLRGVLTIGNALPYRELGDILAGHGTIDEGFDVTEKVISVIGSVFPSAIPEAAMIEIVLRVANSGVDLAAANGFTIRPGEPDLTYEQSPNFKDR